MSTQLPKFKFISFRVKRGLGVVVALFGLLGVNACSKAPASGLKAIGFGQKRAVLQSITHENQVFYTGPWAYVNSTKPTGSRPTLRHVLDQDSRWVMPLIVSELPDYFDVEWMLAHHCTRTDKPRPEAWECFFGADGQTVYSQRIYLGKAMKSKSQRIGEKNGDGSFNVATAYLYFYDDKLEYHIDWGKQYPRSFWSWPRN